MTAFKGTEYAATAAGGATPPITRTGRQRGPIMWYRSYTAPASSPPGNGDTIDFGYLPRGFKPVFAQITCSNGAANATVALGDGTTADAYLAATAVVDGTPIQAFVTPAKGCGVRLTAEVLLRATFATAGIEASSTVTVLVLGFEEPE